MSKKNTIYASQHGFKPGHCTIMSLLNIQDNISTAIDYNEYSLGVFIDMLKPSIL